MASIQHSIVQGQAMVQVGNTHNEVHHYDDKSRDECLERLRVTDPRDDKLHIEETKGGLLEDSYLWILDNPEYREWLTNEESQLLWIRGDPGKGKTMLLCGIINELKKKATNRVAYFFSSAVLRGIIYVLVKERPFLFKYLQDKIEGSGEKLFEDSNSWWALSNILANMLADERVDRTFLVIDGLDECVEGLESLLKLIAQNSSHSSRVKWIVSSRNWQKIEQQLDLAKQKGKLCLELNESSISTAVSRYIDHRVSRLTLMKTLRENDAATIRHHLCTNANDTFLWVALVCHVLGETESSKILGRLHEFSLRLDAIYERMVNDIRTLSSYPDLCMRILHLSVIAYRPLCLPELQIFLDLPETISKNSHSLKDIIASCGSFLTIRNNTVYFVHLSAKDFFLSGTSNRILFNVKELHYQAFSSCVTELTRCLKKDVYCLRHPGFPIEDVIVPDPDPLAAARYPCIYWVDHLVDGLFPEKKVDQRIQQQIYKFLSEKLIYWLEALSLIRALTQGTRALSKLYQLFGSLKRNKGLFARLHNYRSFDRYNSLDLIRDAQQFTRVFGSAIECAPLQVYASGGDHRYVASLCFSPDGQYLASGSENGIIRIWNVATGTCFIALQGHKSEVNHISYSRDGTLLASTSEDVVRIWARDSCYSPQALIKSGMTESLLTLTFSEDSKYLMALSNSQSMRIWNTMTGLCHTGFSNWKHTSKVLAVGFSSSPDKIIFATEFCHTVIWDAKTNTFHVLNSLQDVSPPLCKAIFSSDGRWLATSSKGGKPLHVYSVVDPVRTPINIPRPPLDVGDLSFAFSSDDENVALSGGNCITWWNLQQNKGKLREISNSMNEDLNGLERSNNRRLQAKPQIESTVLSPNNQRLAQSRSNGQANKIWDTATGQYQCNIQSDKRYTDEFLFSADGQFIAGGRPSKRDKHEFAIWDASTGCLQTKLIVRNKRPSILNFISMEAYGLILLLSGESIELWNVTTGKQAPLDGANTNGGAIHAIVSPDGELVASVSRRGLLRVWSTKSGLLQAESCPQKKFSFLRRRRFSDTKGFLTFSPDRQRLAVMTSFGLYLIWHFQVNRLFILGHDNHALRDQPMVFSEDSERAAVIRHSQILIYNLDSKTILTILNSPKDVDKCQFLPDGEYIVSLSSTVIRILGVLSGCVLKSFDASCVA
ncbi:Vegetative incompatibility protein HET-E-1 [Cladobotryum mycophilum]|uniref:Vegetative incompatibility protein HET-E-1 n=1 Tax=Cladobotryum mycophilum TaxID=491253 RepID=A0ABR0SC75_9HYPO